MCVYVVCLSARVQQAGADATKATEARETPLHCAVWSNNAALIEELIKVSTLQSVTTLPVKPCALHSGTACSHGMFRRHEDTRFVPHQPAALPKC